MTMQPVEVTPGRLPDVALRYALIPVHGPGIAVATVARMLDLEGPGTGARILGAREAVPYGAVPVLVADTTAYGSVCVEHMLRAWDPGMPRPWLVLVADAPVRPAPAARYRYRALKERFAGVAQVDYLPSLRTAEGAEEALENKDVKTAAAKLRRQMEGN
ncbi:hypothetical protein AB0C77_12640 [Streptomyces sp. NPDC048629]|uniref:hypothetical protein n=1 Tax=Streptomyces sp. NPDC048629 TaxID=3154824 RepID=UPI0034475959